MAYAAGLRSNTLSSRVTPDSWLANVVLVLAGSALMAACARIRFEFSFSTVPVTGQTFALLLIGALYGSRLGAATMIAYLAQGAATGCGRSSPEILRSLSPHPLPFLRDGRSSSGWD